MGLDLIPLNFPLEYGPGPDPPQFPPGCGPGPDPPQFPPGCGPGGPPGPGTPPRTRHTPRDQVPSLGPGTPLEQTPSRTRHQPPGPGTPLLTELQMPVKTLPCPNLVAGGNKLLKQLFDVLVTNNFNLNHCAENFCFTFSIANMAENERQRENFKQ